MTAEQHRFLSLFDALTEANNAWMNGMPKDKWNWVPFDNPNMKFGDRISTITIKSVFIHTIVGEVQWASLLPSVAEGGEMKMDPSKIKPLTQQLDEATDLIDASMQLHAQNMDAFGSIGAEQLAKNIRWTGRDWTVMGFLWGIYSHRSYHLGNIDIFMREANEPAPDFFSNFHQQMA
ncbi:MAG: hypothetical protein NWT00_06795 [Beijerinckiaceae bacterium]|jgi:uncharacterized damage-inducible protein DinB|nr:hypothetical protein [Beijerinckiaceae bacterium]